MPTNELLPFGTAGGANVLSFAEYQALTARQAGFVGGTAKSKELNTVWRQAAFVAAMIGQFTVDNSGQDVLDDGNVAAFLAKFKLALQGIPPQFSVIQELAKNQPFYPEILAGGNVFSFAASIGQVVINTGLLWQHRGLVSYSTADFSAPNRTFSTLANRIYHLVWDAPGTGLATPLTSFPNGKFTLLDQTAASPVETDPSYDTTYDRMLVAKVVTDGTNAPTVTPLINKVVLDALARTSGAAPQTLPGGNGATRTDTITLNWARTPEAMITMASVSYNQGASFLDADITYDTTTQTRYTLTTDVTYDNALAISIQAHTWA